MKRYNIIHQIGVCLVLSLLTYLTPVSIQAFSFNQLGMRGGMIAPQQFYGDVFKAAPKVSIFTRFDAFESGNWFLRDLRFEPEFGFTQLNFKDSDSKFQIFTLGINAVYMINSSFIPSRVSPFVGIGAGYYYGSLSLSKLQESSVYTNPSFRGLAGADIMLAYNFGFSIGATYDYIYDKGDSLRAFGGFLSVQYNFSTSNITFKPGEIIHQRPIYPSMSSVYSTPNTEKDGKQVKRELARITFKNNTKLTAHNVRVMLCVPDLMASNQDVKNSGCTLAQEFSAISGGDTVQADLRANFDGRQFLNETDDKQVNGLIKITGIIDGHEKSLDKSMPITLTLKKRNDFKWKMSDLVEDAGVFTEERVVSFMAPDHPGLARFAGEINKLKKNITGFDESLQNAILVYTALRKYDLKYKRDPNSDKSDSINFPFETMVKGGDCDDLVVLYGTLLYMMGGMDIAFVTTSNHIFVMVNTGEAIANRDKFHENGDSLVMYGGTIWIPVEVTEVGNSDFVEAWKKGATQYKQNKDLNIIRVSEALEKFPSTGWHGQGNTFFELKGRPAIESESAQIISLLHEKALRDQVKVYEDKVKASQKLGPDERDHHLAKDYSDLAATYGQFGRWQEAKTYYEKSLALEENSAESLIGLGNSLFELSDQKGAEKAYLRALAAIENIAGQSDSSSSITPAQILATLAEYYHYQDQPEKAKGFYEKAVKLDDSIAKRYAHIRSQAKASESGRSRKKLIWIKR